MITETKYFTPLRANQTLPLVRKIIRDILDTSTEVIDSPDKFNEEGGYKEEVRKKIDEIFGFIKELEEIGCYYKDYNFTVGLVDFPAIIDGHEVFLCWRSDEAEVEYYHSVEKGYVDRKPIPVEYLNE
mgnify:CR=1 FL=1